MQQIYNFGDPASMPPPLELLGALMIPATGIITADPDWWAVCLLVAPAGAEGNGPDEVLPPILMGAPGGLVTMLAAIENALERTGDFPRVRFLVDQERARLLAIDDQHPDVNRPTCKECGVVGDWLPGGVIRCQHAPTCSIGRRGRRDG